MPIDTNSDTEATHLLNTLKAILRERKIGYRSIADAMQVSLPTVKRMLNQPNLPLDRLLMLCKIAKISPDEVFALAENNRPKHYEITPEQDDLFFKQPCFLSYFQRLLDGHSADEIAEEHDLTEVSTGRYLSGLEKVGLIERQTGTRFKLLISPPIGFGPDSKVLRSIHVDFLQHTMEQIFSPDRAAGTFAIIKPMDLTTELHTEMIKELRATIDKYSYLSENPAYRDLPDRKAWNLAFATGPDYPDNSEPIVNL
ncbi:MAG: helix-turn-helix transcriptional regulator [Verrucomicrobiales bacterium]|nr:helix-turn-helix transcriptional regulator [Verrucomicrobiales bacterium]